MRPDKRADSGVANKRKVISGVVRINLYLKNILAYYSWSTSARKINLKSWLYFISNTSV
jgi:hypothetical protein